MKQFFNYRKRNIVWKGDRGYCVRNDCAEKTFYEIAFKNSIHKKILNLDHDQMVKLCILCYHEVGGNKDILALSTLFYADIDRSVKLLEEVRKNHWNSLCDIEGDICYHGFNFFIGNSTPKQIVVSSMFVWEIGYNLLLLFDRFYKKDSISVIDCTILFLTLIFSMGGDIDLLIEDVQ